MNDADARVAWFHCFAGIAGDMALGSLLDAGAELAEIVEILHRLPVVGWELDTETVLRSGISCTRAVVHVRADDTTQRTAAQVASLVRTAALPARVEQRALAVFGALADAEGRVHHQAPHDVHFPEVGAHDAIVDVVGTAAALEVLGIDAVAASPVAVGTGTVAGAHGTLPNPAPAVVRLLEGAPTYGRPLPLELTTPTGAAILRALATSYGPMPAMTVTGSGYGAGSADLDGLPNCTQVVVGTASAEGPGPGHPVTVLETNLDDATGEQLADALAALLDGGALDAWVTPAVMKKGRPGQVLHALCDPSRADALRAV
ncbi:MAG: nickel pincer cofactor biosynthesis protein LarC, partial [Acidimicrobiales bacterium]